MTDNCKGLAGRIFGHDYSPRYSYSAPTLSNIQTWGLDYAENAVDMMNASKSKTYHGEVCRRCGRTTLAQKGPTP